MIQGVDDDRFDDLKVAQDDSAGVKLEGKRDQKKENELRCRIERITVEWGTTESKLTLSAKPVGIWVKYKTMVARRCSASGLVRRKCPPHRG